MAEFGAPEGSEKFISSPKVVESASVQEASEPVANLVEKANWFLYRRGAVTRRSVARNEDNPQGIERPLFARARRAQLLQEVQNTTDPSEKKKIIEKAHAIDSIVQQYLSQSELSITLPQYGTQTAKRIHIKPPESVVNEATKEAPPIFVIGGIANDIECMGNFLTEIALSGREVVAVAYPDSYNGAVTSQFAKAVVDSPHYEPHAAFFKAAIGHHFLPSAPRELWGYSTGAPIVAEILNDPKHQEVTDKAVFVCPASTTTQSEGEVKRGVIADIGFVKEKGTLPNLTWTTGLKEGDETEEHKVNRKTSFAGLLSHVATADDAWCTAKVKEGGEIVFVTADQDKVTRSWDSKHRFTSNPQSRVVPIVGGYHATPMVQPERVIPQILTSQAK